LPCAVGLTNVAGRDDVSLEEVRAAAGVDARTLLDDAFDAAVSALAMWHHRSELEQLPPAADDVEQLFTALSSGCIGRTMRRHTFMRAPAAKRQLSRLRRSASFAEAFPRLR